MRTAKWNWVSTLGVAVLAMILSLPLSSQTAWGKDPLTIRLVWKINPTFSALIVAKEKGYYAREGLNLNIGQGAGEKPAIQSVVAGKDEFAFATGLATAKAIDRDVSIIMVANYIKRVPMAVAAHPDIPLRTPKDLEGNVGPHPPETLLFPSSQPLPRITTSILTRSKECTLRGP